MSQPANIGSVEFLVKFDTISTTFKKAMKEAFEKADIDGGGVSKEVEDMIKEIKSHLDILNVNFPGGYLGDLTAAQSRLRKYQTPEYRERLIDKLFSDETALEKLGLDAGATKEEVKERVDILLADLTNFVQDAFKTPESYFKSGAQAKSLMTSLEQAKEGTLKHVLERIMDQARPEKKVVEATIKYLEEELGMSEDQIGKTERLYDILSKKIEGAEDVIVENHQELLDYLMEHLTVEEMKRLFFGSPEALKGLDEDAVKALTDLTVEKGVGLPRALLKTLLYFKEELSEEDIKDYQKAFSSFKNDFKLIVTSVEEAEKVLEVFGQHMKEEDREKLLDRIKNIIELRGFYMLFGESKTFGSLKKFTEDMERLTKGMPEEILTSAFYGQVYSTAIASLMSPAENLDMAGIMDKFDKAIESEKESQLLNALGHSIKLIDSIRQKGATSEDLQDMIETISAKIEEWNKIKGG